MPTTCVARFGRSLIGLVALASLPAFAAVPAGSFCQAALAVVRVEDHVFETGRVRVEFRNRTESLFEEVEFREATFAMSLVWQRHRSEATVMRIDIYEIVPHAESAPGAYNFVLDRIELATHWLEPGPSSVLSRRKKMILVVAHEATHRVQKFRGEPLPDNHALALKDPTAYADHPAEKEAYLESLHVAKFMYPAASGSVLVGERRFDVPERSWYAGR